MQEESRLTGGCHCGAVRFETAGPPLWAAHCHCRDCRRTTGAPMVTYVGFPRSRLSFTKGAPKQFRSSPGAVRSFCGDCGTPLTYEGGRWPDEVHLLAGTFDRPEAFVPQAHVYVAEQMPWLHLADDLPKHQKTSSG